VFASPSLIQFAWLLCSRNISAKLEACLNYTSFLLRLLSALLSWVLFNLFFFSLTTTSLWFYVVHFSFEIMSLLLWAISPTPLLLFALFNSLCILLVSNGNELLISIDLHQNLQVCLNLTRLKKWLKCLGKIKEVILLFYFICVTFFSKMNWFLGHFDLQLVLQVCLNLEKQKKWLKWYKMLTELKLVCIVFYVFSNSFCIVTCKAAKTLSCLASIGPENLRVTRLHCEKTKLFPLPFQAILTVNKIFKRS